MAASLGERAAAAETLAGRLPWPSRRDDRPGPLRRRRRPSPRPLCDIESVSGDERALADAVEAALRALAHLEVTRDGDTVVARTDLGRPERVVLAGHIDTVPLADNVPTSPTRRRGASELCGRGTVDMKAASPSSSRLAAALTEPTRDVTWVFYDNEEVEAEPTASAGSAGQRPELAGRRLRGAAASRPTAQVEGGCQGTLRAEVDRPGWRAHSARSWMGDNAIHDAGAVLRRLDGVRRRARSRSTGWSTARASTRSASRRRRRQRHPGPCVVTVNYRFAPDKTRDAGARRTSREVFDGFDVVGHRRRRRRPARAGPPGGRGVRRGASGGAGAAKFGWTDVARFSALGVPAVNYGPGDPNLAHADDEHVPVRPTLRRPPRRRCVPLAGAEPIGARRRRERSAGLSEGT